MRTPLPSSSTDGASDGPITANYDPLALISQADQLLEDAAGDANSAARETSVARARQYYRRANQSLYTPVLREESSTSVSRRRAPKTEP